MDRLACIKSFVRAVETSSFSAVAREMQTTQPTISKQIAALEKHLDVQLLTRSTRKLQLTEAGKQFYAYCQDILDMVAVAEASVGNRQLPSGNLRVSCPISFGQLIIIPRLKKFLSQNPQIEVDLMMTDHFVNLVEEDLDLAIRIGKNQDTSLVARHLANTKLVTITTTSYLQTTNEPQSPQDLIKHNCIIYTGFSTPDTWHFQDPSSSSLVVKVKGNLRVNNSVAIRQAVLSGLGIAVAPLWFFEDMLNTNKLKILFPTYQLEPLPIYAVYRRGRFRPARASCFIEYLASEFKSESCAFKIYD